MNSALLDTNFLITLANPARPHHDAAVGYFRECVRRQVPMYLSTIVISSSLPNANARASVIFSVKMKVRSSSTWIVPNPLAVLVHGRFCSNRGLTLLGSKTGSIVCRTSKHHTF